MTAVRDRRLESASLPSLDVFPLFSLLMSVRMQVSFLFFLKGRWEGGEVMWRKKNKTTRKQKKTKRTSVSDKVLTERLQQVLQTCG